MKKTIVLLLLVAGCSSSPQTPVRRLALSTPPPPVPLMRQIRIAGPKTPTQPLDVFIPWQYPPEIVASNYCWRVQASTNLVDWQDWTNCQTGEVLVTNLGPVFFFRLLGTSGQ